MSEQAEKQPGIGERLVRAIQDLQERIEQGRGFEGAKCTAACPPAGEESHKQMLFQLATLRAENADIKRKLADEQARAKLVPLSKDAVVTVIEEVIDYPKKGETYFDTGLGRMHVAQSDYVHNKYRVKRTRTLDPTAFGAPADGKFERLRRIVAGEVETIQAALDWIKPEIAADAQGRAMMKNESKKWSPCDERLIKRRDANIAALTAENAELKRKLGAAESAIHEHQPTYDAINEVFMLCGTKEELQACGPTIQDRCRLIKSKLSADDGKWEQRYRVIEAAAVDHLLTLSERQEIASKINTEIAADAQGEKPT